MSVHKILKRNKFHLYKMRLVHELNDFDRRIQFCETMIWQKGVKSDIFSNVFLTTVFLDFSNEATF